MKRTLLVGVVLGVALLALLPAAYAAPAATCTSYSAPASEQLLGSVTVDSTSQTGSSFSLPASGDYRLVACGVWNNYSHGYVDAAYNSGDAWSWATSQQGWPGIGPNWGELTVNGTTPDWGSYDGVNHTYSTQINAAGSASFLIWDGYPTGLVGGWYGDNGGSLSVDVYKVNHNPTSADQCKKDGWKAYGIFKNQGDCVSFVATGGKNPPAGS